MAYPEYPTVSVIQHLAELTAKQRMFEKWQESQNHSLQNIEMDLKEIRHEIPQHLNILAERLDARINRTDSALTTHRNIIIMALLTMLVPLIALAVEVGIHLH